MSIYSSFQDTTENNDYREYCWQVEYDLESGLSMQENLSANRVPEGIFQDVHSNAQVLGHHIHEATYTLDQPVEAISTHHYLKTGHKWLVLH
jgi:hypothetical protein